jgi:hypothetical protein
MVQTTSAQTLQFDVISASPMVRLGTMRTLRFASARDAAATLGKPTLRGAPSSRVVRVMTALLVAASLLAASAVVTVAVWRDVQEQSARR